MHNFMAQIKNHNLVHLYISPLEQCNLNCQICYTQKNRATLSQVQLLDFVERYSSYLQTLNLSLETITLCGGEIFLLPWIVQFINKLNKKNIIVEIITNGTINRLAEFSQPNLINLIISIDGLPEDHDANRGQGNFAKTWQFLTQAHQQGFHFEIFSVITQRNFDKIEQFEQYFQDNLGFLPDITYHPRKPLTYLENHPVANCLGEVSNFEFLTSAQLEKLLLTKKVFPPLKLGCHQISVMSDGNVYACCEGVKPLGKISDQVSDLVADYQQLIKTPKIFSASHCDGCAYSNFVCGFGQEYAKIAHN